MRQRRCRVHRSEADRDVVEDLGQDAAQPDEHGRPELRVAAEPEDELDARRRHRLDEQAADRQAVPPPGLEQRQGGAVDRVVATQPERQPADLALVGQPDGIELERDRPPDPARRGDRGRRRRSRP